MPHAYIAAGKSALLLLLYWSLKPNNTQYKMTSWGLYPNNPKRELRCRELTIDIAALSYELSRLATDNQALLAQLDSTIRAMYASIQASIPSFQTTKVNYHGWVVFTAKGVAPILFLDPVFKAVDKAAVAFLLRNGRIGPAAFTSLVGLPTWLKIGSHLGAGLVVVVGVDIAISAIAGSMLRDKLRSCIHSCVQPRINLKKAQLINKALKTKLHTVVDSLRMMRALGYTEALIDRLQAKVVADFRVQVGQITDTTARQDLAALDKSRGSWTNEG